MLFLVDVVPVLSERAGLPPGTPVKMFEVRMNAVSALNPFFPNLFSELTLVTILCVLICRK